MIMKKCILIFICSSVTFLGHASSHNVSFFKMKFSDTVNSIVSSISNHNVFESAHVGFAGVPSRQYILYKKLDAVASNEELRELAKNNKNAVVRLYAFEALLNRKEVTEEINKQFQNDQAMVYTLQGCVGGRSNVKDVAHRLAQNFLKASKK